MLFSRNIVSFTFLTAATALRIPQPTKVRTSARALVRTFASGTGSSMAQGLSDSPYWNRETSQPKAFSSNAPIVQKAKIVALASPDDPHNFPLYKGELPEGAELLAIGTSMDDFDIEELKAAEVNVVFVSAPKSSQSLAELLTAVPSIQWVHSRLAGIDFCNSETLIQYSSEGMIQVTNSKGCFSSTLAEYTMLACGYFAKDLPRLMKQKQAANWEQYPVLELRGATMGVVGYGDIGRAGAKLAKAYGMKIIALRRNPDKAAGDPIADVVYGNDKKSLNRLFQESDYVLCATPLTSETEKMIGKEQFDSAKKGSVFINIGRGPVVDEPELVKALQDGRIKGAGLDVMAVEPLPKDSPLWTMDNVLLSPHNMDMTETFMKESTEFFVQENLPRFLRGVEVLNPVNPAVGY